MSVDRFVLTRMIALMVLCPLVYLVGGYTMRQWWFPLALPKESSQGSRIRIKSKREGSVLRM